MLKVAAPAILFVLAGCAAAAGGSTQTAANEPTPRALEGRNVGEPVSCVNSRDIEDTDAITDRVILFHMRGNRVYRNDLPRACPRVSRVNTAIVHRSINGRLCDVDIVQVIDPTSGFGYGACQLGKFQPYELPEGASRDSQ